MYPAQSHLGTLEGKETMVQGRGRVEGKETNGVHEAAPLGTDAVEARFSHQIHGTGDTEDDTNAVCDGV